MHVRVVAQRVIKAIQVKRRQQWAERAAAGDAFLGV